MIRSEAEITVELQDLIGNSDDIAQSFYEIISQNLKTDEIKYSLLALCGEISSLVAKRGPSEQMKKCLNDPTIDKSSVYNAIEREVKESVQLYYSLIADYLSQYRYDKDCMSVVEQIYSSYEVSDYKYYKDAQENLGILYTDEKCVLYNLREAFLCFTMSNAKDSNCPDVLYGFAKSISASGNAFMQGDALRLFKRAFNLGHEDAKIEYEKICRHENLCTSCGGQFKGVFVKKCSKCGKKKDYK